MESVGDLRAAESNGWRMRDVASGSEIRGMPTGNLRGGSCSSSTSFTAVDAIVADQVDPRPERSQVSTDET